MATSWFLKKQKLSIYIHVFPSRNSCRTRKICPKSWVSFQFHDIVNLVMVISLCYDGCNSSLASMQDSITWIPVYESLRFNFCTIYSFEHYSITSFSHVSYAKLTFLNLSQMTVFTSFSVISYKVTVHLWPAKLSGFVQWIYPTVVFPELY